MSAFGDRPDHFAAAGDTRSASAFYLAALRAAPPSGKVPPELLRELRRAQETCARYAREYKDFLRTRLAAEFGDAVQVQLAEPVRIGDEDQAVVEHRPPGRNRRFTAAGALEVPREQFAAIRLSVEEQVDERPGLRIEEGASVARERETGNAPRGGAGSPFVVVITAATPGTRFDEQGEAHVVRCCS